MNTLGTLLVHIDASTRSETRIQLAQALAAQGGADGRSPCVVNALYGTTPSYLDQPFAYAESAVSSLMVLQDLDAQRRSDARKLFDRLNTPAKPAMRWHELKDENAIAGTTRHAMLADLVLLGQHDPDNPRSPGVPADFVESVLIDGGRPGLVVPCAGSFATVGRQVLIAWKPTREAARALGAAIPLLQRARQIHVVAQAGDGPGTGPDAALQSYLRAHGIEVPIKQHAALAGPSPGEGLLSLAADVGADLLVMGCYGHSRARELVLGGASRTVLRSMTLPVLMAH